MGPSAAREGLQLFRWEPWFETGLSGVDKQHHHLVDLLNQLSAHLCAGEGLRPAEALLALEELETYARVHFRDEEQLMQRAGIAPRHLGPHVKAHSDFQDHVGALRREANRDLQALLPRLVLFTTDWLTLHILDVDQAMARQLRAIEQGRSPKEAFESNQAPRDPASAALLAAVHSLHDQLQERNADLARANARLEEQVAKRTWELQTALGEVKAAQSQLLHAEKMSAVGQLAAGVAHEINNPLAFVIANLELLDQDARAMLSALSSLQESRLQTGSLSAAEVDQLLARTDLPLLQQDLPELLAESREGLDRVKRIVQSLRSFSHADDGQWQLGDLEQGLESTLHVASSLLKHVPVERSFAGLPQVECLPGQLNQVFLNLLLNAAQAGARKVQLRTGRSGEGEVWVEVEDDGSGMSEEVQRRIFEPFFTTKPVGQGTGLGLSIAFGIIQRHHGRIEVDSHPGRGTRMRVVLPLRKPHAEGQGEPEAMALPPGRVAPPPVRLRLVGRPPP